MRNTNNFKNPYNIGKPIYEPEKFFGREELFQFIEDNLRADIKILLLHGQRRIGKSSILEQFAYKIPQQEFIFVCFDLQDHSDSSLSDLLYNLAEKIAEKLALDSNIIPVPSEEDFKKNPDIFYGEFLPKIYQRLGEKNLVLLLDEFDVVSSDNNILNHGNSFFRYLQILIKQQDKLFIILVLGRSKDDFKNLSQLFNSPPFQEVGLLNDLSARRLITKPAEGMLEYDEDAIQSIFRLSAGQPYFTQAICFNLFMEAKIANKWKVTREDVREEIVDKAIKSVEGGLIWFWDGLSIYEKVVFSAVAEAQKLAFEQKQLLPEEPFTRLKNYGVIQTEELIQAAKQLVSKGYLDDTERRVKIELVRRWLVQSHPLNQEIFQLDEIEKEEINKISEKETQLYRHGKNQDVIDHYEEILKLNPNHFSTIPILAERYLKVPNFDKALKLYTRAYQVNPNRNQEGLLLAREAYSKNLREQGELIKAKVQLEGVLEIERDRESAKQQLIEIDAELETQKALSRKFDKQVINPNKNNLITAIRQPVILGTIATVIAIIGGSIRVNLISTSCSEGQQRVNDSCVSNQPPVLTSNPTTPPTLNDNIQSNISRGDRTLFFTIPNTYRDQGIKEFKEGHYPQAVKLFEEAVKNNRKDPEVRMYYNNAKAHEKANSSTGAEYSPLTLAVVIPANLLDVSQEMLRGVAQSQQQFNANGGLNGRLLEIVIANDSNNPAQAKQIAQELVNNKKSLLGVIGHGISKTTQAALPIYKQAGIPIISPTSSANVLQGKNFFRTIPSDAAFGEKLGKYATNYRLNKVVIVYNPEDTYSNSLREEFKRNFQGQIIDQIDLTEPTLNIEQKLKDSASQNVQAIMLFPDVEHTSTAVDIAKVNFNNNLRLKLLGGDSLYNNQKILQDGGNAFEGLILAVPWFRETSQAKDFSQAAKQLWEGDISWRTATSYDATQAFIKSLSFQPSSATIWRRLQNLNLSPTVTSGDKLKFYKGERQSKAILVKVEQGKFKCLQECSL